MRITLLEPNSKETHHTQKKDSPGGTAITLAEDAVKQINQKDNWANSKNSNPKSLVTNSFRKRPLPEGFALGAVMVAEMDTR